MLVPACTGFSLPHAPTHCSTYRYNIYILYIYGGKIFMELQQLRCTGGWMASTGQIMPVQRTTTIFPCGFTCILDLYMSLTCSAPCWADLHAAALLYIPLSFGPHVKLIYRTCTTSIPAITVYIATLTLIIPCYAPPLYIRTSGALQMSRAFCL